MNIDADDLGVRTGSRACVAWYGVGGNGGM